MRFLSLQSLVAYGHVGNAAVVFPLQRLGHEVWPVPTVVFSNHTGYGAWRGPLLDPEDVRAVVTGIEERGVLDTVDGVLSGYLGSPGIIDVVLDAVARVKGANPGAAYTCDPVMGNATSGCFVDPALPPLVRERVVPAADVITPNQFELGFLVDRDLVGDQGRDPASLDDVLGAAHDARALGPETVLVTSLAEHGSAPDEIGMLAVTGHGAWVVRTPRVPMKANGSGDVTSALFSAHLRESDPATALARTAASVHALLAATHASGERELRIVAAQEVFVDPPRAFEATRVD